MVEGPHKNCGHGFRIKEGLGTLLQRIDSGVHGMICSPPSRGPRALFAAHNLVVYEGHT